MAGSYTNVSSLITAINTSLAISISPYSGLTLNFSTTINNSGYQICVITTNASNFNLNVSNLTTILGFIYSSNRITTTGTLLGKAPINLYAIDTCLYMQISNIPIVNNNNFSQFNIAPYTFKIPLNNIINNTIYFNDSTDHQKIIFNDSSFILDKLNIVIYGRVGESLTGYYDWTSTLIIEYSENNTQFSNEINFLNLNN